MTPSEKEKQEADIAMLKIMTQIHGEFGILDLAILFLAVSLCVGALVMMAAA